MSSEPISIIRLAERITTEAEAYKLLEDMRWGEDRSGQSCPKCGSVRKFYFIAPKDGGETRKTNRGTATQRRRWKCADCRHQFSVLTGTIFHGTKISVRKWLFVIFEMCASKNGISAREIERKYELTAKSAWFMTHRIREAMKREPMAGLLANTTVVADETFIGGLPKNKHQQGRKRPGTSKGYAGTPHHKTAVLSLVDKTTGEVRSRVVPNVTGDTLRDAIAEQVDTPSSHLHTDGHAGYRQIGHEFVSHEHVAHDRHEYVRGDVSTNQAENFFSQLKRSIDGTHHHVSPEHLPRYLAEFDYRYSTRDMTDTERMRRVIDQTQGRRLSWKPLRRD
ncbi:MAG: IS1595 family transposase [Acidimicrobiales bacterium]